MGNEDRQTLQHLALNLERAKKRITKSRLAKGIGFSDMRDVTGTTSNPASRATGS